jgi:hypothetical protein
MPHSHRRHRLVGPSHCRQQSSGGDRQVLHQGALPRVMRRGLRAGMTKGQGRLAGAFAEASAAANAYRGELLGLMAVHRLLLAVKTVSPGLSGSATIYSDCLGALGRVAKLPPYHIPSQCQHLDILKTIMVNCANLSFQREHHHVVAHQDDHTRWKDMSRAAQLNSACDTGAKAILCSKDVTNLPLREAFPAQTYLYLYVRRRKEDPRLGPQATHVTTYAAHLALRYLLRLVRAW